MPRLVAGSVRSLKDSIRSVANVEGGFMGGRHGRSIQYIRRLEAILNESPQISITLSDLAHILDLERTYCSKVFRRLTGESFSVWTRKIRIEKAKFLLCVTGHSITDVSHAVGYDDITTFERNFRKQLGVSPTHFRRVMLEADASFVGK